MSIQVNLVQILSRPPAILTETQSKQLFYCIITVNLWTIRQRWCAANNMLQLINHMLLSPNWLVFFVVALASGSSNNWGGGRNIFSIAFSGRIQTSNIARSWENVLQIHICWILLPGRWHFCDWLSFPTYIVFPTGEISKMTSCLQHLTQYIQKFNRQSDISTNNWLLLATK